MALTWFAGEIWSRDGRLLAQSRQLALFLQEACYADAAMHGDAFASAFGFYFTWWSFGASGRRAIA